MAQYEGSNKDRRGFVSFGGQMVQAWHYRITESQPEIEWTNYRVCTLNGRRYEFGVMQDGTDGTGNAYAYFWWKGEILFFQTGTTILKHREAIGYAPPAHEGGIKHRIKDRMRPLVEIRCRSCGKINDAHTDVDNTLKVPHDGDLSICAYCGTWSVFRGGDLHEPTPAEAAYIDTNPNCISATRVFAALRGEGSTP